MPRSTFSILILLVLVLFSVHCTDEDTIMYTTESQAAIYGRVVPPDPATEVAAWQATEIRRTTTDSAGYFSIADIKPGVYELRITPPWGRTTTIGNVKVRSSESTYLGEIRLSSLPSPLVGHNPPDGTVGWIPAAARIEITSEKPLNMASLGAAVTIEPSVQGSWSHHGEDYEYDSYFFTPLTQFAPATHYTVTIGPGLEVASIGPWGDSVSFSFTTDSMHLVSAECTYYCPGSVPPDFSGIIAEFTYTCLLDEATIAGAIRTEPAIGCCPVVDQPAYRFNVCLEGDMASGTTYRVIVDETLADIFGHSAGTEDTVTFSTESFRVLERYYPSARTNVPPRVQNGLLSYRYNVAVDLASAISAVSIDPPAALEITVSPSYSWDKQLYVNAPAGLRPGTLHTLTIDESLSAEDGGTIGCSEEITFQVQPLMVTGYGFPSGYSGTDTITDPGTNFDCRIYLNADVNVDSFNLATSISPSLDGFWYLVSSNGYYDEPYLNFFLISPLSMAPEETYTVTIDGSVGLVDAVGFGQDVELRLMTRPVMITYIYPSQGTQSVPTYQSVTVRFNAPMDHPTTEAAFEMTTWSGTPVPGSFYWYTYGTTISELQFSPTSSLTPGTAYKVTIDTTAESQTGHNLKEPGYTFFRVSQ